MTDSEKKEAAWDLDSVVQSYRHSFARSGDSAAAVQWPRGRQNLRFDALTRHIHGNSFSVLDFGCGLAHLKDYLSARFESFSYSGVDIVPEFVQACAVKHPECSFSLVRSAEDVRGNYDHVLVSGAFNVKYFEDEQAHRATVRAAIERLFTISRVSVAINFMTDRVDYRQPNAFHENPGAVCEFVSAKLSPRLVLDQSYMPYEFTVTVFKDHEVLRPDNVYREY